MVREFEFSDEEMDEIRWRIRRYAGISLSPAKRELIYTRVRKRLRHHGLTSFSAYLEFLAKTPEELQAFVNSLTTNHTSFFRETQHFDVLRTFVAGWPARKPLRVWCAAASTGEEPYSIAITIAQALGHLTPNVGIVATDIDTDVLAKAKRAVYPDKVLDDVDPLLVKRYFLKGVGENAGCCRVRPEFARSISFSQLNLLNPRWEVPKEFDVIFCRNVFFYFDRATQVTVLERLTRRLHPDGLLFTGHSENFFSENRLVRSIGHSVYRHSVRGEHPA